MYKCKIDKHENDNKRLTCYHIQTYNRKKSIIPCEIPLGLNRHIMDKSSTSKSNNFFRHIQINPSVLKNWL